MIKNNLSFCLIMLLCLPGLSAQNPNCNKSTSIKGDEKYIPKGVCVPKGMVIYQIYTKDQPIDFNKDGLTDFIFDCSKDLKTKMGDSTFLYFYTMNKDSSFTLFKKYDNILPIYFDPNDEDISRKIAKNNKLTHIYNCYGMSNPLEYIEVKNDTIILVRTLGAIEKRRYTFKFNSGIMDWQLAGKIYITDTYDEEGNYMGIKEELPVIPDQILSRFSYCEED